MTAGAVPIAAGTLGTGAFARLSVSYALASIPFWMTVPLAAVVLARAGVPAWQIGLVGAVPWLVLVAVLPWVAALAARHGAAATYRAGVLLAILGAALFVLGGGLVVWVLGYAALGAGIALRWVIADGVIAALSPAAARGRRIGVFETVVGATMALGPLIPAVLGAHDRAGFVVALGLSAAALLPMRAGDLPAVAASGPGAGATGLGRVLRTVPLPVLVATLAGVLEGAGTKLLPVQATVLGHPEAVAVLTVAIFGAGNLVTQIPAGWIADRIGPLPTARATLAATAALALLGPLAAAHGLAAWAPVLLLLGGAVGALYTVAVIAVGRLGEPTAVLAAVAAVGLGYTAGSALGPVLGGVALSAAPGAGLALAIAGLALAGLAALGAGRRRAAPATTGD